MKNNVSFSKIAGLLKSVSNDNIRLGITLLMANYKDWLIQRHGFLIDWANYVLCINGQGISGRKKEFDLPIGAFNTDNENGYYKIFTALQKFAPQTIDWIVCVAGAAQILVVEWMERERIYEVVFYALENDFETAFHKYRGQEPELPFEAYFYEDLARYSYNYKSNNSIEGYNKTTYSKKINSDWFEKQKENEFEFIVNWEAEHPYDFNEDILDAHGITFFGKWG